MAPHNGPDEHGLADDEGQGFAGVCGRTLRPGRERRSLGLSLSGGPFVAGAFAGSGPSRIAGPPAASSTGGSPAWMHRTKWRISSTNIWFRSVLIDSWKTSTRRSSLPYTATDCVM